jgi:hypothetical protein
MADVLVTFDARTYVGANGTCLPMSIVQAASLDVLLFGVTDLTLILCGYNRNERIRRQKKRRGEERSAISRWLRLALALFFYIF